MDVVECNKLSSLSFLSSRILLAAAANLMSVAKPEVDLWCCNNLLLLVVLEFVVADGMVSGVCFILPI